MTLKNIKNVDFHLDKQAVKVVGVKGSNFSEILLDLLKLEASFCKRFFNDVSGLDFEFTENNLNDFNIKIKGKSNEIFVDISSRQFSENSLDPVFVLIFKYNEEYFPLKKDQTEKQKNISKLFLSYAKNEI